MKCNIIAQRIAFQEYCLERESVINGRIDYFFAPDNEAEYKELKREDVERQLDEWFGEFIISRPSDYFLEHQTDDSELVCNIQTVREFLLSVLEFFGLPEGYMNGNGHFPDFGKKDKGNERKMQIFKGKKKPQKKSAALEKLKKERGIIDPRDQEEKRPTHFDLQPFSDAFKKFLRCEGKARSKFRLELGEERDALDRIFVDEYGEPSFKKVVDVMELEKKLEEKGVKLSAALQGLVGPMLRCFGDIVYDLRVIEKMPEEEKKAPPPKPEDEEEKKDAPPEEEEKKEKEPPKPIKVNLYETSIHDLL